MRCVVCANADPADGWTVCARCADRVLDDLARIAELVALAGQWLTPQATGGAGVRAVPGSRPPLSLDALDACIGNDVLPVLEEFERMTREHFGLAPYGPASAARGATVKGCVEFLRSWLGRIVEEPDYPVEVLAGEVRILRYGGELPAGHFMGLENLDPDRDVDDRSRLKCPGWHPDADGTLCHARIVYDREHPTQDLHCQRCGTTWTASALLLLALKDETQTVWAYPEEIRATTGVRPDTLRQWVKRGHVPRLGGMYDAGVVYRKHVGVVTEVAGS